MSMSGSFQRLKQSVFLDYAVAVLAVVAALFVARMMHFR
jgi:hypothetical protein